MKFRFRFKIKTPLSFLFREESPEKKEQREREWREHLWSTL